MGVFDKLSGLFGGSKGGAKAKPVSSPRPIPAGGPSPSADTAKARVSPPQSPKPQPPKTASSPAGQWSRSEPQGTTSTLDPESTRVVIDLADDSEPQASSARQSVSVSSQDPAMLSDVPPPPPAYTSPATVSSELTNDALEPVRTPKNRQELIEELQKNYSEVVKLVRKVDGHLDSQDKRSERMLAIAESIPAAIEDLSEIRRQHSALADAIEALTEATRKSASSNEAAQSLQIKALGEVRALMETSEGHERRVAESLEEFKSSIGEVAVSTGKLGGVLEGMESRQARRENELRQAIESGQKWMATAVVLGLVCLGIVVIVGVLAFA